MVPMMCEWRKPKTSRDEPDTPVQSGTLLDFVCDQAGFIHGLILDPETGELHRANYDLIRLVKAPKP